VPEGHSLVLAARRLAPIVGQPVTEGVLSGAAIEAVEARGKHLMIRSDDGRTLHVHLGMHGAVRLRPSGSGTGRHVLRTPAGDAVVHHPSRYAVRSTRLLRLPLGPDLLGDFDRAEYLRRARLADRPIGEVLLDQRVLAGVGNVVKSEALWRCRVSPFAPVSTLSDETLSQLADVSAEILRAGVAARGRLPSDVHKRGSRPCPRCRTPIRRDVQGDDARSTYWCPTCQPPAEA
jgi:endonuclease-8